MHACQLNDVRVDKRGIRGVCTLANLMASGSQQRGIRGVCAPANLMTCDKRGIRAVCTPEEVGRGDGPRLPGHGWRQHG